MRSALHRSVGFALCLAACVGSATVVSAQALEIRGRVLDRDHEGVPGAAIELQVLLPAHQLAERQLAGEEPEVTRRTRSDADGEFILVAPAAGFWKVLVQHGESLPASFDLSPLLGERRLPDLVLQHRSELVARLLPEVPPGEEGMASGETPEAEPLVESSGESLPSTEVELIVRGWSEAWQASAAEGWWPADRRVLTRTDGFVGLPCASDEKVSVAARLPGGFVYATARCDAGWLELRRVPLRRGRVVQANGAVAAGVQGFVRWPFVAFGASDAEGYLRGPFDWSGSVPVAFADVQAFYGEARLVPPGLAEPPTGATAESLPDRAGEPILELPPMVHLSGQVIDTADERPLPGAWLWVGRGVHSFHQAGRGGAFTMSVPETEAATLRCGAPGYLTIAYGPFAEDMADLEARLTPAVSLPGRVVDGDGEAISGAAVRSARPHGLGWNRHFGRLQGTGRWLLEAVKERSGDDGRFTVGGLVPSRGFELRVSRAGYAVHYQPVPPMEPGQVVDELVITLTRGRSGFGRVVNEHEMPIVGSEVQLLPTLTGPAAAQSFEVKENFGATTDSEGVFILHDLPLGTYYLAAKGRGFPELLVPGVEIEDGEGPLDLGTIVLVPGIVLAGEVVDETGAAVAGAELSLRNADGEQIVVQRATSPWFATTTSRHNGSYHLEGLPQKSRLALLVTAEGFLPQIVPLTIEDDDQRLDIELQTGARVTGRVFDRRGRGVSATVDFRPLPGRNRSVAGSRSVNTDSEGHFEAAGIQPDTYTIIAVAGSLQSEPIQRELTSEGLTDLDLQLRQWGSLEVTVVDSSGAAASQVWLSLASKAKPGENSVRRRSAFGVTGSDGIAVLQPLGAGAYELTARRSAFEPVRTRVEIEGDRPHSLRLRLEDRDQETHPVAGRVVDSAGLPVNGVEVRLVALGSGWARDRSLGRTGPAGTFEFRATAGEHRLICRHESYATHTSEPFLIPEGGRSDLLVELVEGAIVAGRISGLELEDLARLKVVARGPLRQREPLEVFGEQYGVVNFDGEFRVSGLQAGEWIIRAELLNPTRSAQERIEVPQGTDELRVDLRFADGYRMTGSVLQPGGPLAGATVTARCAGEFRGETFTDSDGRFVIDHIPHGRCTIVATDGRTGDSTRQTIEFDVDIELVLELGGL